MSQLKICRICLRTEAKGYKSDQYQLRYFYEEVLALKVNISDALPQWFCFECAAMLHKFHKFKEKCYTSQKYLKELLWKGPITYEAIYKADHSIKHLQSTLGRITVTDRVKSFVTVDEAAPQIKFENNTEYNYDVPVHNDFGNGSQNELTADSFNEISYTDNNTNFIDSGSNIKNNEINTTNDNSCTPISIIVEESNIVELKTENLKKVKSKKEQMSVNLKEFGNRYLSEDNWKKVNLTEEEAVKEFRDRAEDPKYLDAAYKCGDCFKGFSKKEMLSRHVQSRHSEELGPHECRFCRMRFKWNCLLRKHLQQHFTKYECLRCHIIFHLDTSALLHEQYHSGTTKKCAHCNEEFRHVTTYYTHVRSHRSAHVCPRCGAAFVSAPGLAQHKRRTHPPGLPESPDSEDDEPSSSYCERCDIRFETRKAYEEHLFHSDMHMEVIKREEQDDVTPTKKILSKRLRAKITNELRKRKSDLDTPTQVKSKRWKRIKRKHRKPSTCHQCGQQFPTQAACMKHHVAQHPRTSYFAPAQRHICELCGASLAPGSVAVHQNMHSREKVHTCETCGRQFHSGVGLKRHLVTHTGEKPFACSLCDKRFTQSNSMKLHYRTFHLKQPYPKRTRKKKKEEQPNQTTEQEDTFEEESDSLPEPEPALPEVPPEVGNVRAVEVNEERIDDENMHYLTLS